MESNNKAAKSNLQVSVTQIPCKGKTKKRDGTASTNTIPLEDGFNNFYWNGSTGVNNNVLIPPYDYTLLEKRGLENNTLPQCVTAYEVNIDGTGYSIELAEGVAVANQVIMTAVKSFFKTPFPGLSMIALRRALRRDMENTGCGYLEVIRTMDGELAFLNNMEAKTVRLVKLDDAVPTNVSVIRNGKQVSVTMNRRERRFAQVVGTKIVYFKEYGASRDLNVHTGEWAAKGSLEVELRATEVMYFPVGKDSNSPYGVPRWINQVPSVVGSRKAEEGNLSYLDSGGVPPLMIFVSGGKVASEAVTQIQNLMLHQEDKNTAAIVELVSTSGNLDSSSKVDVKVERFDTARLKDSMFEVYDDKCEKRVRSSFRLPPIFVGRTQDFNFATASASYMVAEAQVFQPERTAFDHEMNRLIQLEFLSYDIEFRSSPLNVKDTVAQLAGLTLATTTASITNKTLLDSINDITNLHLVAVEGDEDVKVSTPAAPAPPTAAPESTTPVQKSDARSECYELAESWVSYLHGESELEDDEVAELEHRIQVLPDNYESLFNRLVSNKLFGNTANSEHDEISHQSYCPHPYHP